MLQELKHQIKLDLPVAEAMHHFTPEGEEAWVDDWVPKYIHPTSKTTTQGMFFTTEHGGETTYWSCLNWEPENGFVKYLRLNPGSRVSFVSVQLTALSANETQVDVTYAVKPLVEMAEGIPTQEQFSEHIGSWKGLVEALPRG